MKFEQYIFERIKKDNYRGYHLSQHNRLPFDKVHKVLNKIYEITKGEKFNIPLGDDDGEKQKGCEIYYKIVDELNKELEQVTINSLKKNLFPDLDRMGFLHRYDKDNKLINREKRSAIYAAQLTKSGIEYATQQNPKEQFKLYIDATEKLLEPIIDSLFTALYKQFESISVYEFMFIFSDYDCDLETKIKLIKDYRNLSKLKQIEIRNKIQAEFDKINQNAINKRQMRDFGNWYNETLQIMNLLNQTIYFKTFKKTFLMLSLSQEALEFRATRSESEKIKALQWHEIQMKASNYELHHIFPISYASSKKDLDLIDDYRNLIYIKKETHSQISRKNNLLVKLIYNDNKIILSNPFNTDDLIDITNSSIIKPSNIHEMIKYNQTLLTTID